MAPPRVARGVSQASESYGAILQGDAQSQNVINYHLSSPLGNSASLISGTGRSNLGTVSGDIMNYSFPNNVANSGPSVGASSLLTDANSAFLGAPQLQRSANTNTDSYLGLPTSPLSFSSHNNNVSTSTSSVIDETPQQAIHTQHQLQQGVSTVNSHTGGRSPLAMGPWITNSFVQDPAYLSQIQKKQRFDIRQEDILKQQALQQVLQRQDGMQFQGNNLQFQANNPHLQAVIYQQRLRQHQQMQQAHLQQQQHQLRQNLQQQQQITVMKNPYEIGGVCARRLMQYLYHQRQKPSENSIAYWRKFVAEYYSPCAKKRWCLSHYDNVGQHASMVFPQASMGIWNCEICGSKSGRGFEATYEVLPRLNEILFGTGVIDELLYVDLPREHRFPNGLMLLEYGKAVQESVYEQLRVVREGQLRIVFTQELKILSWDFCALRHEELIPRSVVAPQVNQLLRVAQLCQSPHANNESDKDLQTNSNMFVTASRQLAKSLELQPLNGLGFSKRYARSLQTAEVVNSMKALMDFCRDNNFGPIDGLKNYPRYAGDMENPETEKQLGTRNPNPKILRSVNNHQNIMMRQTYVNSNDREASSSSTVTHNNVDSPSPSFSFQSGPVANQSQAKPGLQQHIIMEHMLRGTPRDYNAPGQNINYPNPTAGGSSSSAGGGLNNSNNSNNQKATDVPQNFRLTDDMIPDLPHNFADSAFFKDDFEGDMGY